MKVLQVYTDFADAIEELSDAEKGRLFAAMLRYAQTGAEPVFRGVEKVLWPVAKRSIDKQVEAYHQRCETNRRNITRRYESIQASTNRNETNQKNKENRNKLIDDEEEKDIDTLNARAREDEDPIFSSFKKAESAIKTAYMASVGIPPTKGELNRLSLAAMNNGMVDLLAEAIDQAARNGARNLPGYAIALLEEWSGQGIKSNSDLVRYQRIMEKAKSGDLSATEAYSQLKQI